ncbi:docking protein 1-like isoform X1 [Dermacentor andersoni]|uniref:docking protein 1-like isoform X1 n=1 Tax=Dermacentor andersoni TaxID=34620 RepID=UPI00215577B9|nr:docking protein 1-like isoform X1 [Dermacentor andersoni]
MGTEETAKTGYLHVLHQGFLKGLILLPLQKSWLHKYCALYDSSRHGVKRLEVYDSEESFSRHAQQKCITLEDCIKVVPALQKHQPNVFEVHTRTQSQQFSADSFGEMTEWIEAIRGVTFGQQAVATSAVQDSPIVEEENTLYGSLDAPHVFRVRALPTEAGERCGMRGSFFLLVGPRGVTLAEQGLRGALGAALLWWPYYSIRRYGLLAGTFSLEAGRKAASGEGLFSWHAADAEDIFRAVASFVRTSRDGSALLEQLEQHCYENVPLVTSAEGDPADDAVQHVRRNGAEYAVVHKSSTKALHPQ